MTTYIVILKSKSEKFNHISSFFINDKKDITNYIEFISDLFILKRNKLTNKDLHYICEQTLCEYIEIIKKN